METRLASRVNIDLKVVCKTEELHQQKFCLASGNKFEVKVLDISILGIGLQTKYFLPKGLIIDTEIEGAFFGLQEVMKIKGEVRYCNYIRGLGYRCGIKFLNISNKYKDAIIQFIAAHERRKEPRVKLSS
ncbi:MAG: PilZ domain-containing protein [Candidatus Omnitrophota bacterium]|jgi:c-di-GMP-binding flagellar brake protein YcgR|nr:MAG: PilZ domain-containing protein [Candidatus Omnitrophota bacterium]